MNTRAILIITLVALAPAVYAQEAAPAASAGQPTAREVSVEEALARLDVLAGKASATATDLEALMNQLRDALEKAPPAPTPATETGKDSSTDVEELASKLDASIPGDDTARTSESEVEEGPVPTPGWQERLEEALGPRGEKAEEGAAPAAP